MKIPTTKIIVAILVTTLIISTLGSMTAISMFGGFKALTGAWGGPGDTVYGAVNLSIQTSIQINFTDDSANFGTGYICPGCTEPVTLATDGTNDTTCNCGWNIPNGFLLENQGNTYVRVNLTNLRSSDTFIGGTNPGYAWKWANFSDATCTGANPQNLTGNITYSNLTAAIADPGLVLCEKFNFTSGNNRINISFKISIPTTAMGTGKNDTWTAKAVGNP
ncbi:MAG: hypothetical protein WC852_04975 [Candidatus Nanoarchaeia archaeon]